MVLKPPLAPEKLNKRYNISEMNIILSDEYPAINILNTDDNDFEQQMLARLNYSDRVQNFISLLMDGRQNHKTIEIIQRLIITSTYQQELMRFIV